MTLDYDIIVIGGGHAGCEAASAAARLGSRTLLLTMDMAKLAAMSCNPAVGGVAKGQIVREIDALGGQMGRITDLTTIQFRMLNRSKGAAMWSPRAQCDKTRFRRSGVARSKTPGTSISGRTPRPNCCSPRLRKQTRRRRTICPTKPQRRSIPRPARFLRQPNRMRIQIRHSEMHRRPPENSPSGAFGPAWASNFPAGKSYSPPAHSSEE